MKTLSHIQTLPYAFYGSINCLSFPKSGNTYLRIILANYIKLLQNEPPLKSFNELNALMPEYGRLSSFSNDNLRIQNKRVIKSHHGIYSWASEKNIVIFRDFIEVASSYSNYSKLRSNEKKVDVIISSMEKFLSALYLKKACVIFYDSLINKSFDVISKLLNEYLSAEVKDNLLVDAIEASSKKTISKWKKVNGVKFINSYKGINLNQKQLDALMNINVNFIKKANESSLLIKNI